MFTTNSLCLIVCPIHEWRLFFKIFKSNLSSFIFWKTSSFLILSVHFIFNILLQHPVSNAFMALFIFPYGPRFWSVKSNTPNTAIYNFIFHFQINSVNNHKIYRLLGSCSLLSFTSAYGCRRSHLGKSSLCGNTISNSHALADVLHLYHKFYTNTNDQTSWNISDPTYGAACALCAATDKILTPGFDGFIGNSIRDWVCLYWLSYCFDILFVRSMNFVYYLTELFN